jgi:hypothetical protein
MPDDGTIDFTYPNDRLNEITVNNDYQWILENYENDSIYIYLIHQPGNQSIGL